MFIDTEFSVMGGSGGGDRYPTGGAGSGIDGGSGAGGSDGQNCDLEFTTTLFGPVPGVADQLKVGDILDIRLIGQGAAASIGVIATHLGSQQVGTISGARQIPTLVDCLSQDVAYDAEVVSASGSQIRIRVTNQ